MYLYVRYISILTPIICFVRLLCNQDTADLCIDLYKTESASYIRNFTYLRVDDCGHDIISSVSRCSQQQQVIDGIIANIQNSPQQ